MEDRIWTSEGKINIGNMPELPYALEEALNRLRINISFLRKDIRKIMVISTTPDEGKSFITMQLWRQMAGAGVDSVLVDADLRKSVMVEKYEMKAESGKLQGMTSYLSQDMSLQKVVYETNLEHAYLLPNIDNVVNPSMLLEGTSFKDALKELSENFRYVFIDAPPLGLVSDGEKIGSLCDGAVLVVRGGVTSKRMVQSSIRQLERAGCPLLGIVLNRVQGNGSGYYSKRYGKGYYGKHYYGKNAYGSDYYY